MLITANSVIEREIIDFSRDNSSIDWSVFKTTEQHRSQVQIDCDLLAVFEPFDLDELENQPHQAFVVIGENIGTDRHAELINHGVQDVFDLSHQDLSKVLSLVVTRASRNHSKNQHSKTVSTHPSFAVVEWNDQLVITRWSDEAEILIGIPKMEAEGRPLGKWIFPADDMHAFISSCQSLASGLSGILKSHCRIRRSDGAQLTAHWRVTPAREGSNTFIGIFDIINSKSDVERRNLGFEKQNENFQLNRRPMEPQSPNLTILSNYQEQVGFLAQAVEQLSIGVYVKEERGEATFTVWNKQMERLFQRPKSEVVGKPFKSVFTDPLLYSILGEVKSPHSRNRAIIPREKSSENGASNFIADVTKTPVFDESNQLIALIGIVHDVTERIQSENRLVSAFNELESSKEKLEQSNFEIRKGIEKAKKLAIAAQASNKAKSFFLSNISHELRTPLTSIVSLTHALLGGTFGPMNPKQLEYLEIVSDSSKHLQSLITDILDLSKIELGKLNLKFARTNVSEITQASMRMVMQHAQAKNVKCELTINCAIEAVDVDPKRLKQVLLNLLFNAVKFSHPDTTIGLKIESVKKAEIVTFSISDQGIGIQDDDIEKIFTPFTQLDDSLSKQYEGTGLGLAIVSKLVELHGGGLTVKSRENEGATFTISLPTVQPQELFEPNEITLSDFVATKQKGELALILEENERLAKLVQAEIFRFGFENVLIVMPNELAAYYDHITPNVIIADLTTLTNFGTEWLSQAKAHENWKETKWISTSTLDIDATRKFSKKLGFNYFVPKPITNSVIKPFMY